ncbi:MAG: hypothetical protein LBI56_01930 [Puniceicoccales bacterium]|jgi:hypothetical protein|nr:hypothetical protein [Puniceicoccales bacterium]
MSNTCEFFAETCPLIPLEAYVEIGQKTIGNLTSNVTTAVENIRNATVAPGMFATLRNATTKAGVAAGSLFRRGVAAVRSFVPSPIARLARGIFRLLGSSSDFISSNWDMIASIISIIYAIQVTLEREHVRRELQAIRRAENALGLAMLAINRQQQNNYPANLNPAMADENAAVSSAMVPADVPSVSDADAADADPFDGNNSNSEIIESEPFDSELSDSGSETE